MKINVDSGKYTFVKNGPVIEILRYGEPWHEQETAFNALVSIMSELDAARVVLQAARSLGDDAPVEIKDAMRHHRSLVGDYQNPSDWAAS